MAEAETTKGTEPQEKDPQGDAPQIERGTYEIIRDRLRQQAAELVDRAQKLNHKRLETFGGTEMAIVGNERIRTENNCVPRDIAQAGEHLLFGYNVFLGLKKETAVEDVFAAHRFEEGEDGSFTFEEAAPEFLKEPRFREDFKELYHFYKNARLLQLRNVSGKILAIFQIGNSVHDHRVLRWVLSPDGDASYEDNRGERDHVFEPSHDFEWITTSREDHVQGRHPHVDILGKVFVETVGGDLTVKVEDNTEDGLGVYREPVEDADQALDDAEVHYAHLGSLILLKILPFREETYRYLVFNEKTLAVHRIDAIGLACQQLPEDHGIIFPGGYYLQDGSTKVFDQHTEDLEYVKRILSPNGEDVLYVFHHRDDGSTLLLPYNLIRKQVDTVVSCNGYCIFPSGRMVIFRSTSDEPTRVHAMQVWQTPFLSAEFAAAQTSASAGTYLEKVGNADLVRGVSDAFALARACEAPAPNARIYEDLIQTSERMADAYYWLDEEEAAALGPAVREIGKTAKLVLDEFEKVEAIRRQSAEALQDAEQRILEVERDITPRAFTSAEQFTQILARLRLERGHLISLRDLRYIDHDAIAELEERVVSRFDELSQLTVEFMTDKEALRPYHERLAELEAETENAAKVQDLTPVQEGYAELDSGMQVLSQVLTDLEITDATVRTELLEGISEVLAGLNRGRALLEQKRRSLRSTEAVAEFGAEFRLFSQNVTGQLSLVSTPEDCDQVLARLMVDIEDLEGRYGDFDEFTEQLTTKREEVYEAFSSKKQLLLDQRQRRVEQLASSARRILETVARRANTFDGDNAQDELNSYFAGDPMVAKVRDLAEDLRELGDSVKSDEVEAALKATRQEATRGLRDRQDIFEEGREIIRLGRHRFSVNTQPLDLTLVPRDGEMSLHLSGTDFYEPIRDEEFSATRSFWNQTMVSETRDVYRSEFLAARILQDAESSTGPYTLEDLHKLATSADGSDSSNDLQAFVSRVASEHYDEGYERGVHDHDAARILERLVALHWSADLLRFTPDARSRAALYWATSGADPDQKNEQERLVRRALSLERLVQDLGQTEEHQSFEAELEERIATFCKQALGETDGPYRDAARYLRLELGRERVEFIVSGEAQKLRKRFTDRLAKQGHDRAFVEDLRKLEGHLDEQLQLVRAWLRAFLEQEESPEAHWAFEEACAQIVTERKLNWRASSALLHARVESLLGQHPRIENGTLELQLDEVLSRLGRYRHEHVPAFREFQKARHALLERERERLRIEEYMPRVMSSFVRNQLIDQVYLPVIGDNLAKQMGAAGDQKRTDLMGLLLLISPPGYGKTTLMEYLANRLGLVFMKINGPSLGHEVTSLDPADAPNATARQEIEKVNLSFEMGNNVLLYIDDIQHTSSEFLQKFISLCDGQRRVEGVWNGKTQTYDLRGKKFVVCMAGNPYTESGERFQVPDMLANRADTYNLGDILDGRDDLFALSYIENALTSNPVLAPVAGRDPGDIAHLVRMARGEAVQSDQLSHPYSEVELTEIRQVLEKLLRVQEVLLAINQTYIKSSGQDDAFRTEPRFQLQGSYRNMNKLAEKIVSVMNHEELESLLDDHYLGEAQTLTTGAEHNLLKLNELRGTLEEAEAARWEEIKQNFRRQKAMGGSDDDPITRVTGTLGLVSDRLGEIGEGITKLQDGAVASSRGTSAEQQAQHQAQQLQALGPYLEQLQQSLVEAMAQRPPAASSSLSTNGDAAPGLTPEIVRGVGEQVGQQIAQVSSGLETLSQSLREALLHAGALGSQSASSSGEQVRVIQTLQPGVRDLLEDMVASIDRDLMQSLRAIGRLIERLDTSSADPRIKASFDRTITGLDRLKDLLGALQKIETASLTAAVPDIPPVPQPPEG